MAALSLENVKTFMKQWQSLKTYYKNIAETAKATCEEVLSKEGIQAEYKYRVKDDDSLKTKCIDRVERKHKSYAVPEAVREDIIDLAGVRISLYFPKQKESVSKLIHAHFLVKEIKHHPESERDHIAGSDEDSPEPYSRGYTADHYRVQLKPGQYSPSGEGNIEIQVMSVLHNAWANVRHDITYKALSGKVSREERNILNGLNNLLFTGDWFLDTFHETHIARVGSFGNHFGLGAYLSERFSPLIQQKQQEMKLGLVRVMYDLLETLVKAGVEIPVDGTMKQTPKLNTPQGLDLVMKDLSFEDKPGSDLRRLKEGFGLCELSISVYIMNHILERFKTVANQDPGQCRDKLHIMLSSMVWLDELFPTSLAFEDYLFMKCNYHEKRLIKWMYKHPTDPRSLIFLVDQETDQTREKRSKAYVEEAWELFTRSTTLENPVVEFAFSLARKGVLLDLNDETFLRLMRRQVADDLPWPDWY